jgi:hypothetical protein
MAHSLAHQNEVHTQLCLELGCWSSSSLELGWFFKRYELSVMDIKTSFPNGKGCMNDTAGKFWNSLNIG